MSRFLGIILLLGLLAIGYVAYPVYAMWKLGHALETGDEFALDVAIDWPKVRERLKVDFAREVIAPAMKDISSSSSAERAGSALGMALGSTIAERMLEGMANSRSIIDLYANRPVQTGKPADWVCGLRIVSLTQFRFSICRPDDHATVGRATIVVALEGAEWRVVRLAVPDQKELGESIGKTKR